LCFVIGVVLGGTLGILTLALCMSSRRQDDAMDEALAQVLHRRSAQGLRRPGFSGEPLN